MSKKITCLSGSESKADMAEQAGGGGGEGALRIDEVLLHATAEGALIASEMTENGSEILVDWILAYMNFIVPNLLSGLEALRDLSHTRGGMEWLREHLEDLEPIILGSMSVERLLLFLEEIQNIQDNTEYYRCVLQDLRTSDGFFGGGDGIKLERMLEARRLTEQEISDIATMRAGIDDLSNYRINIMTYFGCFTLFLDDM
jgi:hypothetical protein